MGETETRPTILVRSMAKETTMRSLRQHLAGFGCVAVAGGWIRNPCWHGVACVIFEDEETAQRAFRCANKTVLEGAAIELYVAPGVLPGTAQETHGIGKPLRVQSES